MRKFKRAAVVGAGLLAFAGLTGGVAQAAAPVQTQGAHQGEDITFPGTSIGDCEAVGDDLKARGLIEGYACFVNTDGTVSLTPYYKD